jgi:hydroxysqualene dehydroxylase
LSKHFAVIGAGWAGLAAVSELDAQGHRVTLFESARTVGGRARRVHDPSLGTIDNGQHILLGAYQQTLRLMQREFGENCIDERFFVSNLYLQNADGQFSIRGLGKRSSRLRNLFSLIHARGLTSIDKWHISRLLLALERCGPTHEKGRTVVRWLKDNQQTHQACHWLWFPLCLACLNTSPDEACAVLFAQVLKDSLLARHQGAADLMIPRLDLTTLWPDTVAKRATCRLGHTVRKVTPESAGVYIDQEFFDGCVLAIPPYSLKRLIPVTPATAALHHALEQFDYRAITTCYVKLQQQFPLAASMLLLEHSADIQKPGQWVFDRHRIATDTHKNMADLAFVVSDSIDLQIDDDQTLAQTLMKQLGHATQRPVPNVQYARCITEKRATFAALPNLKRPSPFTPWATLTLAGDWTDTGYPSVLEGATVSGTKAAQALMNQTGHPTHRLDLQ